jgi:hypothetical protein
MLVYVDWGSPGQALGDGSQLQAKQDFLAGQVLIKARRFFGVENGEMNSR